MKSLIIIILIAFWSVNIFGEIAPPCSHSAVANVTEPTCVGNNGSIEVIVTGGTAPYEYNIDGGANQPSNVFSNLSFGGYTIQVIDASGCVYTLQSVVNYKPVSIQALTLSPTCKDYLAGSVNIMAQDGNHIYEYSIDGGANWQSSTPIQGLNSGTYNLVIRDGVGCLDDSVIQIGYSSIDPIISTTNELCDGTLGSINVSFPSSGAFNYTIDGGLTTQNTATNVYTVTGGSYSFQVTNAVGCLETVPVFVDADSIHGSISSIVNESCNYQNGAFNVDITDATPPIEYSIDNGVNYGALNTFMNLDNDLYFVVVRDSRGCSFDTPVDIINNGGVTLSLSNDTAEICLGEVATILSSTSAPNCTYQWSSGLGIDTLIQASPTQNENYELVVTDPTGCTDTASVEVIVHPIPVVSLSVNTINLCPYDSILLTASGADRYVWSTGDTTENFYAKQPVTGNYIKVIGTSFGCSNNDSTLVNIGGVNASISQDQSICMGESVVLFVNALGTNLAYQWSAGSSSSSFQSVSPTVTTNYRVIVTDYIGCKDTVSSTVYVDSPTNIEVTPSVVNGCVGDEITLSAVGATDFVWNNEDSINTITFTLEQNTEVELVGYNGTCSELITVPIIVKPSPSVVISSNTTSINIGGEIAFNNTGSNASYTEWNFGDGSTSILDSPIHSFSFQGGHYVVLTGFIGECTATDTLLVYVGFAGVEELKYKLKMGPNPTSSIFNASVELKKATDIVIGVYSITGERVITKSNEYTKELCFSYDFSNLTKGVYLIDFIINKEHVVKKLVVN